MRKNGVQGGLESKLQQKTCKMVTRFFQNLKVRKKSFRMVCSKLKSDTPTLLWLPRSPASFACWGAIQTFCSKYPIRIQKVTPDAKNIEISKIWYSMVLLSCRPRELSSFAVPSNGVYPDSTHSWFVWWTKISALYFAYIKDLLKEWTI